MNLFERYFAVFQQHSSRTAFWIDGETYTYQAFLQLVSGSRAVLEAQAGFCPQEPVAVVCHNRIETYAAIFATWFSGSPFVPLHPGNPPEWNREVLRRTGAKIVFSSRGSSGDFSPAIVIDNSGERSANCEVPTPCSSGGYVYILTTSGSTGQPKSVPVTLKNLTAFVEGFLHNYPELDAEDRFLQTYDLTADAAFTGYLIPLLLGAAVYTTPDHPFRYLAVAKVLAGHPVTWVQVTPSLLACLRPYFDTLRFPGIKHFHFGGESLPRSLAEAWRPSVPHAEISNVYGPTETTVTSLLGKFLPGEPLKSFNGSVSIGKPLPAVQALIVDESGTVIGGPGEGELLLGGDQVMEGYFHETPENTFVTVQQQQFYRTGDWVWRDAEGFYYFQERLNDQVKINGYRVDLVQVEQVVAALCKEEKAVAAAPEITPGLRKLWVFVEGFSGTATDVLKQIRENYPAFMVPDRIIGVEAFPLSLSGKTDKKKLISDYLNRLSHE